MWLLFSLVLSVMLLTISGPRGVCAAEEPLWPRWYWAARLGTALLPDTEVARGISASRLQQATGMSFGADVGRHLGFEIAGDVFEANLKRRGRDIGEYGVFSLIPQIRLRAALPGTPMTPYLLAGAGVSLNEFNDRKKPAVGLSVRADDLAVVGTVGAGLEYTLADDIAIGAELRYLVSRGHEIEIAGRRRDAQLDALLATANLRLLFSGQHSVESLGAPDVDTAGRYYLALRIGGATITDRRIGGLIEATPENAAVGDFSLLLGVGVGVDVGSHLGVELVADGHEPILKVRGVGAVGEYAVMGASRAVRYRVEDNARGWG